MTTPVESGKVGLHSASSQTFALEAEGINMLKKKIILLGCGIPLLVSIILAGLIVGWIIHISQDVKGISLSIESPLDVQIGDTFELRLNVKNERETKVLNISDIDISGEYIGGFILISSDPAPKSSMNIPFFHDMSYTFGTPVQPGETKTFSFVLRAEQGGIFRGDIDVCEGQRFITTTAQTVVKE